MTSDGALPAGSAANRLSENERHAFERNGYLRIPRALDQAAIARHLKIADAQSAAFHARVDVHPYALLNQHDLVGREPEYLELIDLPSTFPKVFGVLGWNIQLFHTQLVVTPGGHPDAPTGGYAFHQDNNRMNIDFETASPHPRVSVKLAYFLTDVTEPGMGNFCVIPGSHLQSAPQPADAIEITAQAGDAFLFDRRLWHSASSNHTDRSRVVLFYGYSYRWLRPKSAMDFPDLVAHSSPIRRQLLGATTGANGYFDPTDADVPLRAWIIEALGQDAAAP